MKSNKTNKSCILRAMNFFAKMFYNEHIDVVTASAMSSFFFIPSEDEVASVLTSMMSITFNCTMFQCHGILHFSSNGQCP